MRELYSFDDLMNDPEGADRVKSILRSASAKNNTMPLSEFRRYEVLFRYDGDNEIGSEKFKELSTEYFARICPFDPVTLTDESGNVVATLPPVYNRVDTINMHGDLGAEAVQAFINACMLPDETSSGKRDKYMRIFAHLFNTAQDSERLEENKRQSDALSKAITTPTNSNQVSEVEDIIDDTISERGQVEDEICYL